MNAKVMLSFVIAAAGAAIFAISCAALLSGCTIHVTERSSHAYVPQHHHDEHQCIRQHHVHGHHGRTLVRARAHAGVTIGRACR